MASLDLSASVKTNTFRRDTLAAVNEVRRVILPLGRVGLRGRPYEIAVYATSDIYVISPHETQPAEAASYTGDLVALIPAGSWTYFSWDPPIDGAFFCIVPTVVSTVVYVAVSP